MSFSISSRLSTDFTLFNLNDPDTTRFYVRHIDYLVYNFPYFVQIELLTEYFLAKNVKFTKKFLAKLRDFQQIVHYTDKRDNTQSDEAALKDADREETGAVGDGNMILALFPTDESTHDASTETDTDESLSADDSESFSDATRTSFSTSSTKDASVRDFTKNIPSGPDFVINSKKTVFRCFSKVIAAFSSHCTFSPSFVRALASEIRDASICMLVQGLLQEGLILRPLVETSAISIIAYKNIRALGLIIESVLGQTKNAVDDEEEELLDQIEAEASSLVKKFLAIGKTCGYISDFDSDSDETDETSQATTEDDNESKSRYMKEEEAPKEKASQSSVLLNRELESLQISTKSHEGSEARITEPGEDGNDDNVKSGIGNGNSSCKSPYVGDLTTSTSTNSADTNTTSTKSTDNTNIKGTDTNSTYNASLKTHPDKAELQYLYHVLLTIFSNRNPVSMGVHRFNTLNRYVLYHLRLLSYTPATEDTRLETQLVYLLFTYRQNTHLQISVMRMFLKMTPEFLDGIGFIDGMYEALYGYVAASKSQSGSVTISIEGTKLASILKANKLVCDVGDSLWPFLIRLYMRYASYIACEKDYAAHLQEIMKPLCLVERLRYQEKDLVALNEGPGFDRYVVELMVGTLPRASVFEEEVSGKK